MPSSSATATSHRTITSTTADTRGEVICALIARGGGIRTRHTTATITTAADEESNVRPNITMVAYSEAMATTAGITACTAVNSAIRKLCLNRTGWVIPCPLSHLPYIELSQIRAIACVMHALKSICPSNAILAGYDYCSVTRSESPVRADSRRSHAGDRERVRQPAVHPG